MDQTGQSYDINVSVENSQFTEYVRFEGNFERREIEKRDFMAGIDNAPDYDYPYLRKINIPDENGNILEDQKKNIYEGLIVLAKKHQAGAISKTEHALYAPFFDAQLKKIMLVEVASRMRHASNDSTVQQLAVKEDFMLLNRDLYGDMDESLFAALLHGEQKRVQKFVPSNQQATRIKRSLMSYFLIHRFKGEEYACGQLTLKKLHRLVRQRYKDVLAVVPSTDSSVLYDAYESKKIMQAALEAGGLAQKGWSVDIDASKSNPVTSTWHKQILLPIDTLRTADQLRRLIIHEQEVHARRAQNGEEAGLAILRSGTAGYSATEEGLGVLMECAVDGTLDNESYHRVRDRYITAGLALGLDGKPKDSRATFSLLWRLIALRIAKNGVVREETVRLAKEMAMKQTENAFRGTNFLMPGIIYMKLKVYFEGLRMNASYFSGEKNGLEAALDRALLGKYNHANPEERNAVQLLLKKISTNNPYSTA